jgi:hypothetical protein
VRRHEIRRTTATLGTFKSTTTGATVVEALDPQVIVSVTQNDALSPVADEVSRRLTAVLDTVTNAFADR